MTDVVLEYERVLLGSLLLNNSYFDQLDRYSLRPTDFVEPKHRMIYKACMDLYRSLRAVDALMLADHLDQNGNLVEAGGYDYLNELSQGIPRLINFDYYARNLAESIRKRKFEQTLISHLKKSRGGEGAWPDVMTEMQKAMEELTESTVQDQFVPFDEAQELGIEQIRKRSQDPESAWGVRTGFYEIDKTMLGLHPGNLVILAARPSMGKTALALSMMLQMATHRPNVVMFSFEMSVQEIQYRLLAQQSGINLSQLLKGNLNAKEWDKIEKIREGKTPGIWYFEGSSATVHQIRVWLQDFAKKRPVSAVVIDYLHLMQGENHGQSRFENRVQEISSITRGLKLLAKEMNIPILLLSQLNRDPENRSDPRPQLADLRESGSIEQDADQVFFLFRQEYYEAKKEGREEVGVQKAEIICAKNRNGPTGTYRVSFWRNFVKFADLNDTEPMGWLG